jgi:hypothetical protein
VAAALWEEVVIWVAEVTLEEVVTLEVDTGYRLGDIQWEGAILEGGMPVGYGHIGGTHTAAIIHIMLDTMDPLLQGDHVLFLDAHWGQNRFAMCVEDSIVPRT